ncbi:beta-1,4-galactosyltransferase 1-like isoform X2 [Electrophorus electricus]|uniref:beta-1,4-galactosyltransferase 1-like isoform X2 n=1 Tax=Electrophorus electricus TaxID=8005 RepID=UPI0015CF8DF6|nr:beta-1,4-galactosyltransferase 1-like isoform X2 [Electrophorus electricus]
MRECHCFCLQRRVCTLVVALCALHISVMVFYYLRNSGADGHMQVQAYSTSSPNTTNIELVSPAATTAALIAEPRAEDVAEVTEEANGVEAFKTPLEKCPETSPLLVGPLRVEFSDPVDLEEIRQEPLLVEGGHYKPPQCLSVQKVAVIIPYRHREHHLKYWLYYLHPILQRQQLDYGVYIIEQDGEDTFNRAKLLNVGYAEALKDYDYDCFVFSDIDIVPMDDRNMYHCYDQPRHLAVAMDKFGYGLSIRGMSISRPDVMTGKCKMIHHERDKMNDPNPQRFDRIAHTRETIDTDGINSLTYTVVKVEKGQLFTKITVDIGKP